MAIVRILVPYNLLNSTTSAERMLSYESNGKQWRERRRKIYIKKAKACAKNSTKVYNIEEHVCQTFKCLSTTACALQQRMRSLAVPQNSFISYAVLFGYGSAVVLLLQSQQKDIHSYSVRPFHRGWQQIKAMKGLRNNWIPVRWESHLSLHFYLIPSPLLSP